MKMRIYVSLKKFIETTTKSVYEYNMKENPLFNGDIDDVREKIYSLQYSCNGLHWNGHIWVNTHCSPEMIAQILIHEFNHMWLLKEIGFDGSSDFDNLHYDDEYFRC